MQSTWWNQFKILLWKNVLLKRRLIKNTIFEFLLPIYFIAILAITKYFNTGKAMSQFGNFPDYSLYDNRFLDGVSNNIRVLVAPNDAYTQDIMTEVGTILPGLANISSISLEYYADQAAAEAAFAANGTNVLAGVIFNWNSAGNLSYALRFPKSNVPKTSFSDMFTPQGSCRSLDGDEQINEDALTTKNCDVNKYLFSKFPLVQTAVDLALIRKHGNIAGYGPSTIKVGMMPKPAYLADTTYIQIISSMYFVIAFSPLISMLTVHLVAEKEKKIKEGMKMMGLRNSVFWLSWITVYFALIVCVSGVVTIISYAAKFLENSNFFIFMMLLVLYGLSIISLACLLTPFFNKANTAGGLASLGTMVASCGYLIVSLTRTYAEGTGSVSYTIPVYGRWLLSLLSPIALSLGMDQAIYLDIRGGMDFTTSREGEFPLYAPMIMLLVDSVLYFSLAVYFDMVIPGEYGTKYKPYFLFTKTFWSPNKAQSVENYGFTNDIVMDTHAMDTQAADNPDIEPVSAAVGSRVAVRINALSKQFHNKEKKKGPIKAIDKLSLTIYEGQITAILGHNGAGKTTLMNILTGMTSPTSGRASIMGLDVSDASDMEKIREMSGVCPQHNILFDPLTCVEHLKLFAGIKGLMGDQVQAQIDAALDSVGLKDQAQVQSEKLSGGQKRKLSVAIAIIGDPKIIFLDEPTAGMDPYSRRHLWAILKEKKKGRVILLTTHFMDEADILSDRKAIVNKGSLRCCGSSLFLKNRFGLGYHLNMVVEPDCDSEKVLDLVNKSVPGSEVNRIHGKELDITMPHNQVGHFSELFSSLEKESTMKSVGVKNYGVSMTTLEEVFLKLEEDNENAAAELENLGGKYGAINDTDPFLKNGHKYNGSDHQIDLSNRANPSDTVECVTGRALALQRLKALFILRLISVRRQGPAMFYQLVLPVISVIVGLVLAKTLASSNPTTKIGEVTSIQMNPSFYSKVYGGVGQYFPYSTVPKLMLVDDANTADSTLVMTNLSSIFYTAVLNDTYMNDTFKLLAPDISPLYMGLQINQFDNLGGTLGINASYKIHYNDSGLHSIPASINIMNNALLRLAGSAESISTWSVPWPSSEVVRTYNSATFTSVLIVAMAFVFIPGSFAAMVVQERELKIRSQLRVTGLPFHMYWGSFFLVDFFKFMLPVLLTIITVYIAQVETLMPGGAVLSFILVAFTFIPANIMYTYVVSFLFDKFETCQSVQPMIIFMTGYIPYIPISIIDMVSSDTGVSDILHYVFCFIDPPYTIFGGLYYITKIKQTALDTGMDDVSVSDYFTMGSNIPVCYIASILQTCLFFFLLRVLDVKKTGGDIKEACFLGNKDNNVNPEPNTDIVDREDVDIVAERTKVKQMQSGLASKLPVAVVEDLRKEFQKTDGGCCKKKTKEEKVKVAVRNQTFSVEAGEVFGLLGPNGAGKTTTLNMMTADVGPDKGKVLLGGHDIRSSMSEAFQAMGYCPQHDALWKEITLREHLTCYANVRGIPPDQLDEVTEFFIENLKLEEHGNKRSKKLSGGTKRKLSYCMAMMGKPKIVLLDEPSTGLDPQSKRFLWDTISNSFTNSERGAILTTHYMEEADALCSRIAIMVNGRMECIGSSQHLKNKYGSGYLLEIKLNVEEDDDKLQEKKTVLHGYVNQLFPGATVMEEFSERVQYKVPKSNVTSLARAFTILEEGKEKCHIAEYSFSQSTLEQVFLEFAKHQIDEGETHNIEEVDERISVLKSSTVNGEINSVFLEFAKNQLDDGQTEDEQENERKKSVLRSTSITTSINDGDTQPYKQQSIRI